MRLSQTTYKLAIVWRKKSRLLWNLNVGILIGGFLLTRKISEIISEDLHQLKFSGKLLISERMCDENHQLAYKYRQLKNARKIHSTWFWNNTINVKLSERSNPVKIFHIIDIEYFLALTIRMILLATIHFKCSHLLLRCVFHFMFCPYFSNFLKTFFFSFWLC